MITTRRSVPFLAVFAALPVACSNTPQLPAGQPPVTLPPPLGPVVVPPPPQSPAPPANQPDNVLDLTHAESATIVR